MRVFLLPTCACCLSYANIDAGLLATTGYQAITKNGCVLDEIYSFFLNDVWLCIISITGKLFELTVMMCYKMHGKEYNSNDFLLINKINLTLMNQRLDM